MNTLLRPDRDVYRSIVKGDGNATMCPRVNYGDGIAVVVGDVQEALGVYREVLRCLIHCNEFDSFVAGGVDDRYRAPRWSERRPADATYNQRPSRLRAIAVVQRSTAMRATEAPSARMAELPTELDQRS